MADRMFTTEGDSVNVERSGHHGYGTPAPDGLDAATPLLRRLRGRVDRQVRLLDRLRADPLAPEPPGLAELLDTARHIRHDAESLLILVGEEAGVRSGGPRQLSSVLDEAVDVTEEPLRVDVRRGPTATILPAAATELLHIVAELVDHITSVHPAGRVEVSYRPESPGGVVVEVRADGATRHDPGSGLGPAAAGRMAQRSGSHIVLRVLPTSGGAVSQGPIASVHCPGAVVSVDEPGYGGPDPLDGRSSAARPWDRGPLADAGDRPVSRVLDQFGPAYSGNPSGGEPPAGLRGPSNGRTTSRPGPDTPDDTRAGSDPSPLTERFSLEQGLSGSGLPNLRLPDLPVLGAPADDLGASDRTEISLPRRWGTGDPAPAGPFDGATGSRLTGDPPPGDRRTDDHRTNGAGADRHPDGIRHGGERLRHEGLSGGLWDSEGLGDDRPGRDRYDSGQPSSRGASYGLPDNGLPDNGLPDNGLPGGRLPGGRLPDNGLPGGRLADGGLADGGLADGGLPGGRLPDNGLPDNGLPGGRLADGDVPDNGHAEGGRADHGGGDNRPADNGRADYGRTDNGRTDNGRAEHGRADGGRPGTSRAADGRADTSRADTSRSDTSRADTSRSDNGRSDNGRADGGLADRGRVDGGRVDDGHPDNPRSSRTDKPGQDSGRADSGRWSTSWAGWPVDDRASRRAPAERSFEPLWTPLPAPPEPTPPSPAAVDPAAAPLPPPSAPVPSAPVPSAAAPWVPEPVSTDLERPPSDENWDVLPRRRSAWDSSTTPPFPAPSFPAPSFPAPSFPAPSFPAPSFPAPPFAAVPDRADEYPRPARNGTPSQGRVDELFGPMVDLPPDPGGMGSTPIFEAVASAWFRDDPSAGDPSARHGEPIDWESPGDGEWRAAAERAALSEGSSAGELTSHGLPRRRPGGRLVQQRVAEVDPPEQPGRLPERVRERLSGYQRGLQQGRHRAEPVEPPDPVDPMAW